MVLYLSVSGFNLKVIDFLTELQHLPPHYELWEDKEDYDPRDENGFTLTFTGDQYLGRYPFGFKRFLVANRKLLSASRYKRVKLEKEIAVTVSSKDLPPLLNEETILFYELRPWFVKLLDETDIRFKIAKYK